MHPKPTLLKRLEHLAKHLLALAATALLWRPRRPTPATWGDVGRILLVRLDDRVGEALLTTPLIATLRTARPGWEIDLLVHPRCARVLHGLPGVSNLVEIRRGELWLGRWSPAVKALRKRGHAVVMDCGNWEAPSVTHALAARLVALPRATVVGFAAPTLRGLRTRVVPPLGNTRSEISQRLHLLSALGVVGEATLPSFRSPSVAPDFARWVAALSKTPLAVVNPGGRLGWRRIPAAAFAAGARALLEAGRTPVVTWGPGEEALAREVVSQAPGALLAPATDLDQLALLMATAGLTLTNNTGPMHLSVAVGAPTLALFYRMEIDRWGYGQMPHQAIDLTALEQSPVAMIQRTRDGVSSFAREHAATAGPR